MRRIQSSSVFLCMLVEHVIQSEILHESSHSCEFYERLFIPTFLVLKFLEQ